MKRWWPYPLLTAALVAMWLLLTESVALGSILMGTILATVALWGFRALDPPGGRLKRPRAAFALAGLVMADVARSNLAVAKIILNPRKTERVSGFLRIPLDMRAPYGLATLACIITGTPGTIWVEYNSANNSILLHILDLVDEKTWIDTIKGRYEKRLMEIFE
ncbi:multisubunit potassium/proton antiporter PhaE subunit [Azospirillum brasilense]|uniref:Multisubunit potassium/proton antiporter PhaE subunit n=1 Tax=Azospirillum brasilense TaxID=192 RepID=A0A560BYD9_AZOBR|nr:Na+/H+ antiporter subunit E [Azospirillum brasilense]MBK3734464.1 Na+/H+ antiporter subunit E [Azospirillum brasilense]TWA77626.1 multisubunit potassium/proton antiporter PhaE subunit [Azospirillum brasilense]